MCGRYILTSPLEALRRLFGALSENFNLGPHYNIAPTQSSPVVHLADGARRLTPMRWGLVPGWAKAIAPSKPLFNARGETVAEKPSFRDAFRKRRCLVPADGFYEWPEGGPLKSEPVLFRMRAGAPGTPEGGAGVFAFAGIWARWTPPDGGAAVESYAILSTEANGFMRGYHHRIPVILAPGDYARWLEAPADDVRPLITACPDEWLDAYPVSRRVNAVRNDDAGLIVPAAPEPPVPQAAAAPKSDGRQSSLF